MASTISIEEALEKIAKMNDLVDVAKKHRAQYPNIRICFVCMGLDTEGRSVCWCDCDD